MDPGNVPAKWKQWLKRIGWAGFLFFLVKGLIWLAIFFFAKEKLLK